VEYGESTPWDDWKKENENKENEFAFKEFAVYRYEYTDGEKKGELAFDLCGPHEDGTWTVEPQDFDDILIKNTDELIDFMIKLNIDPPLS
jgi:hypothetical protein